MTTDHLNQGAFHSLKKRTRFLLKSNDFYKILTKTIEIPAEGVPDYSLTEQSIKTLQSGKKYLEQAKAAMVS